MRVLESSRSLSFSCFSFSFLLLLSFKRSLPYFLSCSCSLSSLRMRRRSSSSRRRDFDSSFLSFFSENHRAVSRTVTAPDPWIAARLDTRAFHQSFLPQLRCQTPHTSSPFCGQELFEPSETSLGMMSTELGVSAVKTLRSRGVAVTGCHGCYCYFVEVEVELLPMK